MAFARRDHSRGPRRQTQWGAGPSAVDLAITSDTKVIWTNTSVVSEKATIVRIRGIVRILLTAATAAGDGFFGAMGFAVVSDAAVTAGATAMPNPLTDLDYPWLWHAFFDVRAVTGTISDGVNGPSSSIILTIDNKAMRKQSIGEQLVGVSDQTESGTAVLEVQANCRILDKLA